MGRVQIERQGNLLIAICLIALGAIFSSCSQTATEADLVVLSFNQAGELEGVFYVEDETRVIDRANLEIDAEAVDGTRLGVDGSQSVRVRMLEQGLARLSDLSAAPAPELAAQDTARRDGRGLWAREANLRPAPRDRLEDFLTFVRDNQELLLQLFSILAGLGLLGWVARAILNRTAEVTLLGEAASGKTAFSRMWARREGIGDEVQSIEPTPSAASRQVAGFAIGRFTVKPTVLDTSGSEAGEVFDRLYLPWWRWRRGLRKKLLVVMLAPTPRYEGKSEDQAYVDRQLGMTQLAVGVIKSQRLPILTRILVFIAKADLLVPQGTSDPYGAAKKRLLKLFAPHIEVLSNAAQARKVGFSVIVGSSRHGWGFQQFQDEALYALYPSLRRGA